MIEIKTDTWKTFKFYDNIEEMPQKKFLSFERAALIEAGIGSTVQSLDDHLAKTYLFLQKNENGKALEEIKNLRNNMQFIQNGVAVKSLCLAAAEANTAPTDEAVKAKAEEIAEHLTVKQAADVLELIKKKYINS